MKQSDMGLAGKTPSARPRVRRSVCGKVGLAVSLVPWAVLAALCMLEPG
jgi:hypothetical protein